MKTLAFPRMKRPDGLGEEYSFPSSAAQITDFELGSLQLRIEGWRDYTLRELADEEADLGTVETAYNISLGMKMQRVADTYEKNKPVNDILRAMAIQNDPQLKSLTRYIMEKKAIIRKTVAQLEIYKEQINRLSREQSRRESEAKAIR